MKEVLAIDIGRVIVDGDGNQDTSFFGDNFINTPEVPFAIVSIARLTAELFGGEYTHLVSKCGPKVQEKSMRWLDHRNFWERTGIPRTNAYFCLRRHEKAPILRRIGATHFIDDKAEVHSYLDFVPNRVLFRAKERELERYRGLLPKLHRCETWQQITNLWIPGMPPEPSDYDDPVQLARYSAALKQHLHV